MAVAKTYAKMEISGEPFMESKRMYVNVITPKGLKKVRWYSDAEYRRMYPDEVVENDIMMSFNAHLVFGFGDKNYIILYRGKEEDIENWAHSVWPPKAWHNITFGYYTPSKLDTGVYPKNAQPIKLTWDKVKQDDIHMKSHEEVQKIVNNLLYGEHTSNYQGAINDWLQKEVKVTNKTSNETHFGTKHTYNLVDAEGNTYIWETGAKDYACNTTVSLKMKVKEHKEINGEKCTVVWYCKEVK